MFAFRDQISLGGTPRTRSTMLLIPASTPMLAWVARWRGQCASAVVVDALSAMSLAAATQGVELMATIEIDGRARRRGAFR